MINNIIFYLFLISIYSIPVTVAWIIVKGCLTKLGNPIIIYTILKFVVLGYLVPIIFIYTLLKDKYTNAHTGFMFFVTDNIEIFFKIFFCVWLVGVVVVLIKRVSAYIKSLHILKESFNVPVYKEKMLERIKAELGIKGKIGICEGYGSATPFITGMFNTLIYLPSGHELDSALETILTHELNHYKQRDVIWKPIYTWISILYWFNPFSWLVLNELGRWAEASCDMRCCTMGKFTVQEYYNVIIKIVKSTRTKYGLYVTMIAKRESELRWRVKKVTNALKYSKKIANVIGVVSFFVISVLGVYTVNSKANELYNYLFWKTAEPVEEEMGYIETEESVANVDVEYTADESFFDGFDIEYVDEEVNPKSRSANMIDWTVGARTIKMTNSFTKSAGGTITVSLLVTPDDVNVQVGIMEPDRGIRYVSGKDAILHKFTLTQTGNYRVFVKNDNSFSVEFAGYYR